MYPVEPGSREYNLLYTDNDGVVIGLGEVQLLEDVSPQRIEETEALLESDNPFIHFDAMLILIAWKSPRGMIAAERFIAERQNPEVNLSPHRICSADNRYDDVAEAVYRYLLLDGAEAWAATMFKRLINIYPDHFFQGHFVWALKLRLIGVTEAEVRTAILKCRDKKQLYQASQLLPVYVKFSPVEGLRLAEKFLSKEVYAPNPVANVAEALQFVPLEKARQILRKLCTHADRVVAREAQRSLQRWEASYNGFRQGQDQGHPLWRLFGGVFRPSDPSAQ